MFGIKQQNGSWSFYPEQIEGSIPVEVDVEGKIFAEALELKDGKFSHDSTKLAVAKAALEKLKSDEDAENTALETRIARMKLLRAKSRTLAESNELIDLQNDLLVGVIKKFNLVELMATTKRKE